MFINITLVFLVGLSIVERYLLVRRYEKERAQEAAANRLERSELAARVQGFMWRPNGSEAPSQVLVEEPDELGMVGTIMYGDETEDVDE